MRHIPRLCRDGRYLASVNAVRQGPPRRPTVMPSGQSDAVQAVYYRDPDGREPVNDFIDGLPPERQEEIDFKISLLNRVTNTDPPLPFPHSSQVDGQLRPVSDPIPAVRAPLRPLHAMEKRTGALPQADIDIAKKRFADFHARIERQLRGRPRAAGHDAP